jgi:hypothetical protein
MSAYGEDIVVRLDVPQSRKARFLTVQVSRLSCDEEPRITAGRYERDN